MISAQVTRLHISPLAPDFLPAVLGSEVIKTARNISYHDIQTFPEKSYGYIDLPAMEAEKVKKKLNGAILKGKRMKVEEARPKKRKHVTVQDDEQAEIAPPSSTEKKPKKSTKDRDAIQGRVLSPDRKVKRGWTEQKPSSKKERKEPTASDRPTSKYTGKEELLFRTKLPENKADMGSNKKKKSKKSKGSHTVHEFEKSVVQPSFLKKDVDNVSASDLQYLDGQGWVDAEGNVVEKEPSNLRERRKAKKAKAGRRGSESLVESQPQISSQSPDKDEQLASTDQPTPSSPSAPPTPEENARSDEQQIHPLEALFKKPQKPASSQDVAKPSLEVHTSFSFFGGGPDDDIEEEPSRPGTPLGSQDIGSRGLRSAAPTPDTAHPSRFNSYGSTGLPGDEEVDSDEDDEDQDNGKTPIKKRSKLDQQQSDFAKMFWEKRGDNNRSWKARRRTVLKENRQRENRARRPKNW